MQLCLRKRGCHEWSFLGYTERPSWNPNMVRDGIPPTYSGSPSARRNVNIGSYTRIGRACAEGTCGRVTGRVGPRWVSGGNQAVEDGLAKERILVIHHGANSKNAKRPLTGGSLEDITRFHDINLVVKIALPVEYLKGLQYLHETVNSCVVTPSPVTLAFSHIVRF